jgi:hypothetical protein
MGKTEVVKWTVALFVVSPWEVAATAAVSASVARAPGGIDTAIFKGLLLPGFREIVGTDRVVGQALPATPRL